MLGFVGFLDKIRNIIKGGRDVFCQGFRNLGQHPILRRMWNNLQHNIQVAL